MSEIEDNLRKEYQDLETAVSAPDAYARSDYPAMQKRLQKLSVILEIFDKLAVATTKRDEAKVLLEDTEMAELAGIELEEATGEIAALEAELEDALIETDPNDDKNVIVEIRGGAGGDEAALFAGDLYRMYVRYCESHSLKADLISESPSESGGYKEISFTIKGENAYSQLKFESGVHRVQRIPSTESQGRIHTSTATVAVLPEVEEEEIIISPSDLRIDTFRASGHGGQSVNTTDSAVRITHIPTGVVVSMQDEKSQIKNKAKAMGVLRSRIFAKQMEDQRSEESEARRKLIGTGDRSEKIRTYNFPQDRITDHRIGFSRSNIPGALDGSIDDLIDALHKAEREIIKNTG